MLSLAVDAIVNPANRHLLHGGGIAGQIVRRGGQEIQKESSQYAPLQVGEAVITGAGKLPARFVIHAVGPRKGEGNEETKLYRAITTSLNLANTKKLTSIALPAISTGIFCLPAGQCARVMKKALHDFLTFPTTLENIIICLLENEKYRIFLEVFSTPQ